VAHASGRALELVSRATRAVTLADFETLARETPGARVARASAIAGLHPAFPCVDASGVVSVLVIPTLPTDRPLPSPGLRRAVRTYLSRRRLIGTRVEVLEPTYTEVAVRATVTARPDEQPVAVEGRVGAALRRFFSPIEGGPDGTGWPFGRDVYRTEVMHVIKGVDGIVRADSVELSGGGCGWGCSNVCVGPTGLVLSGQHQITVR
jgi:predicted phage baseplate assembly protein